MSDSTADVLKSLREQMARSGQALDKLAPAFVRAWGEIGNVTKNANNPHFGNDYADLSAVLDTIKPVFAAHGLLLMQCPGTMDGDRINIVNMILHESGQHITVTTQLPLGDKPNPQKAGSAISYGCRYAAKAICGMAQVDDDGQAASQPTKKRESTGLLDAISRATTTADLDAIKAAVREADDNQVNEAYVTARKALRGAK